MDLDLDANNNSTDKKGYSLRPRGAPKHSDDEVREEIKRPRERTPRSPKQKSLPLSKYRRKTANARERSRMREINEAFETLRKSIPLISTQCDNPSEKNTKISTLRLAMKYITVLSSALKDSDGESDKDSIFSEYSLLTPPDYRDTYTPTSTSDNSDFSEPFFVPNPSQERSPGCVSPFSSSSSFNVADFASKRLAKWSDSDFKCLTFSSDDVQSRSMNGLSSLSEFSCSPNVKPPPSYELSRLSSLEDADLTIPPPPPYSSSLETDLRFASLTPISVQLQSTQVLDSLDDLSFSRVDLDDFLCT